MYICIYVQMQKYVYPQRLIDICKIAQKSSYIASCAHTLSSR
jgi:hypothetical protein